MELAGREPARLRFSPGLLGNRPMPHDGARRNRVLLIARRRQPIQTPLEPMSDGLQPALRNSRLVPFLVAIGLLLLGLSQWRDLNLESFVNALAGVRWRWALAALAFNLLSAVAGSLAWNTIIREAMPPPHPRYRHVLSAFFVGLLGNIVLPARAGEAARVAVLGRRLGGRPGIWATLVGTVVAYRLLDLLPSLALILYVLVSAPIPPWALHSLVLIAALGLGLLAAGIAIARRHERPLFEAGGRFRRWATMVRAGLGIFRAPLPAATATLYQSVAWLSQLFAVFVTLRAFGLELTISVAALVLVLVNLAILFPLWPGNVGLLQATVALPLAAYAVDYGHAIAFGVGMQAIEVSVGVSLGLLFLAREGLSVAILRRMPDVGTADFPAGSAPLKAEES
jgi:glycosyltransferase 2 family protein